MARRLSGGGDEGRLALGQRARINITPLVGVMLLLLIMVMVASPVATTSLPMGRAKETPAERRSGVQEPLFIDIEPGGKLYIEARPTSIETLVHDLDAAVGGPDNMGLLVVRAHSEVSYSEFLTVMNALKRGGYKTSVLGETT
jgi:biopolymer transport protein ExbD